jgi:hypothetical protein
VDEADRRRIEKEQLINWLDSLDGESFDRYIKKIKAMREEDQRTKPTTSKRKMEKQEYFPTKKLRK